MPRLITIRCPECGAEQQEPATAVSTYCRACSAHIEIGLPTEPPPRRPPRPPQATQDIHCYACGQSHQIAAHARHTTCPYCSAGIEIGEIIITGTSSRPVDLRGRLLIASGARLSSPRILCTDARIEGIAAGTLFCENEVRLASSGRLTLSIFTTKLFVEKRAEVSLAYPVCSRDAEIRGSLTGQLFLKGRLLVAKGGAFYGAVRARSIVVERGGTAIGPLSIGPEEPKEAPALPSEIRLP